MKNDPFLWRLPTDQMLPGDLFFSRSPGEMVSETIRAALLCPYSHVGIYLGGGRALESADYGVKIVRLDAYFIRHKDNVHVRRLLPDLRQKVDFTAMQHFVDQVITAEYATWGAIFSVIPFSWDVQEGKYFCSQLVASALRVAGMDVCPGVALGRITPATLLACPLFEPVEWIIDPLKASDVPADARYLDQTNSPSLPDLYQTALQGVYRRVKDSFAAVGLHPGNYMEARAMLTEAYLTAMASPEIAMIDAAFRRAIGDENLLFFAEFQMRPGEEKLEVRANADVQRLPAMSRREKEELSAIYGLSAHFIAKISIEFHKEGQHAQILYTQLNSSALEAIWAVSESIAAALWRRVKIYDRVARIIARDLEEPPQDPFMPTAA